MRPICYRDLLKNNLNSFRSIPYILVLLWLTSDNLSCQLPQEEKSQTENG